MKPFDGILKSIERKFAYFFCTMRILIDLLGAVLAIVGFFYFIKMANSTGTYIICFVVLLLCFMIVGADIHYAIFRDIKHIRSTDPNRKEEITKKNKIEF